jgi:hypothetical protein
MRESEATIQSWFEGLCGGEDLPRLIATNWTSQAEAYWSFGELLSFSIGGRLGPTDHE